METPELLMFKNNYLLLYSKRTFCLGIKLLPQTCPEGSEDILLLFSSIDCFRKCKCRLIFFPLVDELTYFPGCRISSLFLRFHNSNKIKNFSAHGPPSTCLGIVGPFNMQIQIFISKIFSLFTSLNNLYVLLVLLINSSHQFCMH